MVMGVKVQICIWPSWCHCHSLSLAPVNPDWFYLPGFTFLVPTRRLTQVDPDKIQEGLKTVVCVWSNCKLIISTICRCYIPVISIAYLQITFSVIQVINSQMDKLVKTVPHQNTHTQPFYGSVEFVRENPGEPVPEETFTHYSHHSHQSSLSAFSI